MRPKTRAERSGYDETSLHRDVMEYLAALAARNDPRFHLTSFGVSPEGRELPLVLLSADTVTSPEEARRTGRPVILIINGIHAGEVEGKEASLMLMGDLLDADPGFLDRMVLVVVPLFNPDGNDRIDPAHRHLDLAKLEGQIGPKTGVGTRVNASGINLNRDYMRQDSREMRFLARNVYQAYGPHLTIDCHATNGSVHRYDLTYDMPHTIESGRPEPIEYIRTRFLPEVTSRLRSRIGIETFFYGNFVQDEGGTGEGWMTYPHHPRFGSNYRGLTNRMDILAETYSYLSFPDRVKTSYEFLQEVLTLAAERGPEILSIVDGAREPRRDIAVRYRLEAYPESVRILTREPRTLTGEPRVLEIPHLARFVGTRTVRRPWGYTVPDVVAEHLARHGLLVHALDRDRSARLEIPRVEATRREDSRRILESSSGDELEIAVSYRDEVRDIYRGTWIVRTDQPMGALAVYLCEAESDDGALHCGLFPLPAAGQDFPIHRVLDPL